jgi:transcriptional coactivator HFI1/ADA1
MASLQRADSIPNASGTPTLGSKPLPTSSALGQKNGKPVTPTAPRIDYEPLYTVLKAGIGANWHLYGESVGLFCRGMFVTIPNGNISVKHCYSRQPLTIPQDN